MSSYLLINTLYDAMPLNCSHKENSLLPHNYLHHMTEFPSYKHVDTTLFCYEAHNFPQKLFFHQLMSYFSLYMFSLIT